MEKLYIISNESIFEENGNFFCDNIDIKSTPEGLNKTFEVHLFSRNSKKKRHHKINLKNINISNNIFSYFIKIIKTLSDKNPKYLIISITPYTFLVSIILKLFKKKSLVYLRSDGYSEYKIIFGYLGKFLYHIMFTITSIFHLLVGCRKYILHGKKGKVILPSQLDDKWLINLRKPNLNKIKLLYIGRIRKEKGIFSLINLIGKININLSLTIVGAEKEYVNFINKKNINILNIENDKKKLIKLYDDHNIFVLPSYTEGHPMVLLEALARLRPVIIFKEIKHVIQNKNGIFVSKRNYLSLNKTIKNIIKNYSYIQKDMKKNILPTKKDFIFSLKNIILNM